jgi:hypothetical protein
MAINSNLHKFSMEVLATPFPLASAATLPSGVTDLFVHNWATDLSMETAYSTAVAGSNDNDVEERRGLLSRPHRTATVVWAGLTKERLAALLPTLRKMTDSQWVCPLYQDQVYLDQEFTSGGTILYCQPQQRRVHIGGRVAIIAFTGNYYPSNVAYRTVAAKQASYITVDSAVNFDLVPGKALILPCMDVEYTMEPSINLHTDQTATVTLELQEIVGASALPPSWVGLPDGFDTYDGLPIFDPSHDWSVDRRVTYKRSGSQSQMGRGVVTDLRGDHARLLTFWSLGMQRSDAWGIINFFDSRMGRLIPFWTIDPETIWTCNGVGTGYVDVEPLGDSTDFQDDFTHVGLRLADGTKIVRPVSSFVITGNYWRVQVSTNFPSGLSVSDVQGVARARKSRFNSDALTETWRTDDWATIQIETIELLDDKEITT